MDKERACEPQHLQGWTDIRLTSLIAPCFWRVHADIRRGGHAEYWLTGGRGSGKSSFVSIEILLGLMRDEQANALIYRKVADTLRDSVYAQMLWAIDRLGVAEEWQAKISPMELLYRPTGQRVLFRGADDPQKSKGIKLKEGFFKYLWFEELSEFRNRDAIRTIKASVIRGAKAVTLYTYNPPRSAREWVNKEALVPREGRMRHHSDYRGMPPEWLGDSFLAEAEALRLSDETAWRHMYLGEVTGTGGQVFENLKLRPVLPEEWHGFPAYCGLDFGFAADPDAFVRCAYDRKRRRLYVVDEFASTGLLTDRLAREVRARCGPDLTTCDSAEPRSIAQLRALGLRVTAARKGPDSVEHGLKWLQTRWEIVIDPERCPFAAREFAQYEYDRDREDRVLPRYPDHDNHTIDAVRYAMESVSGMRQAIVPR